MPIKANKPAFKVREMADPSAITQPVGAVVSGHTIIEPTGIKGATSLLAAFVYVGPLIDCKITFAAKGTRLA